MFFVILALAVLGVVLVTNLFQPADLKIIYTAESYFEVRRLFFAAGVLAVLAFMLFLSIAIYAATSGAAQNPAGKEIFDTVFKVVTPIITLVLGYYFAQAGFVKGADIGKENRAQVVADEQSRQTAGGGTQGPQTPATKNPGQTPINNGQATAPLSGPSATPAAGAPVQAGSQARGRQPAGSASPAATPAARSPSAPASQ